MEVDRACVICSNDLDKQITCNLLHNISNQKNT